MYCNELERNCSYYVECKKKVKNPKKKGKLILSLINKKSFLENIALEGGIKPIRKIEHVCYDKIPVLLEKYSNYENMVYSYQSVHLNDGYTLLLSKKTRYLKKFIVFDNGENLKKRIYNTGILLGYPKCCVEKHMGLMSSLKDEVDSDYNWSEIFLKSGNVCPLLSKEKPLFVHKPCNSKCKSTIEISEKTLMYIEKKYGYKYVESFFNI